MKGSLNDSNEVGRECQKSGALCARGTATEERNHQIKYQ